MALGFSSSSLSLPEGFTVTAHSGCEGTADNSFEFLKKCIDIGASVAEIDVTFRRDGTPVIVHKEVAENDEGILFDEVMKILSENTDKMCFNLDLKAFSHIGAVIDIIEKYSLKERCFFTGVRPEQVEILKAQSKEIPYYLNKSFSPFKKHSKRFLKLLADEVKQSGAVGINLNYRFASREMVELFRKNGLLTSFWTANTEKAMKKLLYLAPDNITTRYPVLLESLIHK